MLKKILMFFILTIVLICILISIKHFKEIKTLTNNINGTLYYNDYSNGNEAYSFNFSTSEIEKIYLDDNYEILDYLISSNGYYCIVREQQNNDCFKTFYLQHIDNSDKKIIIPNTSGKLSLLDNGILFLSDYYSTASSFTLSYYALDSDSVVDIKSNIMDYCVLNNTIYFIKESDLFQYNIDTNTEKFIFKDCSQIITNGTNSLYIKTDNGIYKYNIKTEKFDEFSKKNNYKLIAVLNDENIVLTKISKSESTDELEYNAFGNHAKQKYYILSNNKLIHLKNLDGYNIEYANYFNNIQENK